MEVDELKVAKIASTLNRSIYEQIEKNCARETDFAVVPLLNSINQFAPCPQLLDEHLSQYISRLADVYLKEETARQWVPEVFYTFGKIVSGKTLLNYLKTDVKLVMQIIERFESDDLYWQEEYLLLCWICVLSLVPFNFDSFHDNIRERLYDIGCYYVKKPDPLQPLGARLMATLMMRKDCEAQRSGMIDTVLENYKSSGDVVRVGYLQTINICLKKDPYKELPKRVLFDFLREASSHSNNVGLMAKIYSKLCCYFLMQENDQEDENDFEIIEEIVSYFFNSMNDPNTDTRYIIARKFGKVISVLKNSGSDDILSDLFDETQKLLAKNMDDINSDLLHSYLLTIAEALRLRLINSSRHSEICKILSSALFFQQKRITFVSGSNVRDASAFICWSLFKYNTNITPDIGLYILLKLLLVTCFDKDIMIRRSATAAIQELMGRKGNIIWSRFFPEESNNNEKNIRIVEILDYIDLGSIEKSYLEIPQKLLDLFPSFKNEFSNILLRKIYDNDEELVNLSARALINLLRKDEQCMVNKTLEKILVTDEIHKFRSFYALAEVLPLSGNRTFSDKAVLMLSTTKVNHHKDSKFILIAYLSLVNTLLDFDYAPSDAVVDTLFSIMRVDANDINFLLRKLCPKLKLSDGQWKKWLSYIKYNNINASSTVGTLSCFSDKFEDVLVLLQNENIDARARAAIVSSISSFLTSNPASDKLLNSVINQLDDYSVSEQGDVGNKIRFAALDLMSSNIELFKNDRLVLQLEPKLLRIAGEPIDRTRDSAFKLLCDLKGIEEISVQKEYFGKLLQIFQDHYSQNLSVQKEFWRGYIFSAGALKANHNLITSSLEQFMKYYDNQSSSKQIDIILQIASLLKVDVTLLKQSSFGSLRLSKTILVGLNFFSRVFQYNINLPAGLNVKGLYVRIYNLHLNTQNIVRLSSAIKIFGYMASVHNLKEALQRLCHLATKHPISRVRVLAGEELFIVYNEALLKPATNVDKINGIIKILKQADWNKENPLRGFSKDIYEAL